MEKRKPKADTEAFMVTTNGLPRFRRAGIVFNSKPQRVERAELTAEQVVELLNTHTLNVEEIPAKKAAAAPKESAPKA